MDSDAEAFKEHQRQVWSAGDYPDLAKTIEEVARRLLDRVGAVEGEDLLDIATGTGNLAIPAAELGARVTGLDLTPKLLEVARARASEAGVEVSFIEGDAEALPFADASFDRVTSCFGVIFAPRHDQAAGELVRVARPGGTVAFTAWTPEGMNGEMFRRIGSYMPPPPPEIGSPLQWGKEDHVRSLLADSGAEVSFERHTVTVEHDSPESWVAYNERVLGPTIMIKAALEPQGRWEQLRGELVQLYSERNEAEDGSFRAQAEYLLTVARLPA
jgi:SAM-dependent methyltransferase